MRGTAFASWIALAAFLVLGAAPAAHAVCSAANPNASVEEATPDGDFAIAANGTVTHAKTGLMWKQCAEGLGGVSCATGAAANLSWADALKAAVTANTAAFAGFTDWRLPNKKELESIVEPCGFDPAINRTAFPATPAANFWSSTSSLETASLAWFVFFSNGATNAVSKSSGNLVRLVRGGQLSDPFDLLVAPRNVTYNGNGADNATVGVPVDALNPYVPGSTVSVLGNTGSRLVRTGFAFAGWNTSPDGTGLPASGSTYAGGATFAMPAADVTLFAQWTPATAPATSLPDTGQSLCTDNTSVLAACNVANSGVASTFPSQDGRFGRDARATRGVLTKTGGGAAGFDYSKIANNGTDLGAGAALPLGTNPGDWACTRDNTSGLTWEVKTASGLRSSAHTYAWYSSDATTNGRNVGSVGNAASCGNTLGASTCNTQNYIAAVNAARLCNATDWRLPTRRELLTLVHRGVQFPSIDQGYFPNTQSSNYWTGSPFVPDPEGAWVVVFTGGGSDAFFKSSPLYVRLVRGGQF